MTAFGVGRLQELHVVLTYYMKLDKTTSGCSFLSWSMWHRDIILYISSYVWARRQRGCLWKHFGGYKVTSKMQLLGSNMKKLDSTCTFESLANSLVCLLKMNQFNSDSFAPSVGLTHHAPYLCRMAQRGVWVWIFGIPSSRIQHTALRSPDS